MSDVIRDPKKYPLENGNPAREERIRQQKEKEAEKWNLHTEFTDAYEDMKNKDKQNKEGDTHEQSAG